jgi:hypothetical protein
MQKQTSQDQSVFRLLDCILRYTLFHDFDTLGSHLREEGSLDYDGGFVCLQVQMKFDTHIDRQQRPIIEPCQTLGNYTLIQPRQPNTVRWVTLLTWPRP